MNKAEIFNLIQSVKGYEKSLKHDSLEKSKKNVDKPFQKFEFLGDRVLGLVISEYLIENFHKSPWTKYREDSFTSLTQIL